MTQTKNLIFTLILLLLSSGCVKRVEEPIHNSRPVAPVVNNTLYPPVSQGVRPPSVNNHRAPTSGAPSIVVATSPLYTLERRPPPRPAVISTTRQPSNYRIPRSRYLGGAYGNNYNLKSFINMMVSKHHYDRYTLNSIFSTVQRDNKALEKYNVYKPKKKYHSSKTTAVGAWDKYKTNFLNADHINNGVRFWRENQSDLNRAARKYGVAPEYIIGIIGVETNFGGFTGKHSVMNALTTLAMEYKKRSKFFKGELESYLLMIRDERLDPQAIKGSYAGAFGLSQFMPTAFRQHAVDFNGDGHIDLFNKSDAIGSIANYFMERGKWNKRIPVAMRVDYNKKRFYGLTTGFKSNYTQRHLLSLGMRPTSNFFGYRGDVSLIKLSRYSRDELWWGTKNFYAITRYNPRDHYAMAVHQLAQAVKKAYFQRR